MHPLHLDGTYKVVAAGLLGVAFGFLIVKSKIAWRKTLVDQLFLKNTHFMKTFLASVALGAILFHFARQWGLVSYHARPLFPWGAITGGLLVAAGLALCGQVPSSAIAAVGAGRLHALLVLVGMLLAMPVANAFSRWFADTVARWPDPVNLDPTLDAMFSNATPFWIAGLALAACLFLEFTTSDSDDS